MQEWTWFWAGDFPISETPGPTVFAGVGIVNGDGGTRTYSDGSTISAGRQNWWMTERIGYHTYGSTQKYTIMYDSCCRQTEGVRLIDSNDKRYILKADVNFENVNNNGDTESTLLCISDLLLAVREQYHSNAQFEQALTTT